MFVDKNWQMNHPHSALYHNRRCRLSLSVVAPGQHRWFATSVTRASGPDGSTIYNSAINAAACVRIQSSFITSNQVAEFHSLFESSLGSRDALLDSLPASRLRHFSEGKEWCRPQVESICGLWNTDSVLVAVGRHICAMLWIEQHQNTQSHQVSSFQQWNT